MTASGTSRHFAALRNLIAIGAWRTVRVLNAAFATKRYFFGASENAVSMTSPIGCQVWPSN